jgi:hypothetical protein
VKFIPVTNGKRLGRAVVSSSAGAASSTLVGTGSAQSVLDMPTGTIELGTTTLAARWS